jgi:predicted transcriptional regulator YdeE
MKIIGIAAQVSNSNFESIKKHWEKFYQTDFSEIDSDKASDDIIAVYTDYQGDHTAPYTLIIGYEVNKETRAAQNLTEIEITGCHHSYKVTGQMPDALIQQWQKIWSSPDGDRAYNADYDRYISANEATIHVEYT